MTWEQKLQAMTSLVGFFNISLRMRHPGNWYVAVTGRHVKSGCVEYGRYGNGKTPQEAVENDWLLYTNLKGTEVIGVNDKCFKWNGFMWEQVNRVSE